MGVSNSLHYTKAQKRHTERKKPPITQKKHIMVIFLRLSKKPPITQKKTCQRYFLREQNFWAGSLSPKFYAVRLRLTMKQIYLYKFWAVAELQKEREIGSSTKHSVHV